MTESELLFARVQSGERDFFDLDIRAADLGLDPGERVEWRDLEFDGCRFLDLSMGGARLDDVRLRDCEFRNCDLSQAELSGVELAAVEFVEVKALGVDWSFVMVSPLAPEPVRFDRCLLSSCTFGRLDMRRWVFDQCVLVDAGFDDSDLRESRMVGCELPGATFTGCDLRGADLTGSSQYAFDVRANRVAGLKVSPTEGAALLRPFGIELSDP